jgi:hypothetical protein
MIYESGVGWNFGFLKNHRMFHTADVKQKMSEAEVKSVSKFQVIMKKENLTCSH